VVAAAYGRREIQFGPEYLIPLPFDPRLITTVAPAVAEAAMRSGVATRPLPDPAAYRRSLQRYVYTSGTVMQPIFAAAVAKPTRRIAYAEGEDDRVLRARQVVVDERLARPILVGRPEAIAARIKDLGSGSSPAATSRSPASTTRRSSGRPPRSTTASAAGGGWSATSPRPRSGATAR
jgi:malate dehydrogenase (oxaloacetate-decarboxylating)(NADP+)